MPETDHFEPMHAFRKLFPEQADATPAETVGFLRGRLSGESADFSAALGAGAAGQLVVETLLARLSASLAAQ